MEASSRLSSPCTGVVTTLGCQASASSANHGDECSWDLRCRGWNKFDERKTENKDLICELALETKEAMSIKKTVASVEGGSSERRDFSVTVGYCETDLARLCWPLYLLHPGLE